MPTHATTADYPTLAAWLAALTAAWGSPPARIHVACQGYADEHHQAWRVWPPAPLPAGDRDGAICDATWAR